MVFYLKPTNLRTVNVNDLGLCLSNVNKKILGVLGYNANFIILTLFKIFQERAVMNLSFSSLWEENRENNKWFQYLQHLLFDFFQFGSIRIYSDQDFLEHPVYLQWKGQKRTGFLSPFPENKEYKGTVSRSQHSWFFHFAPNSERLSLLFCP